MQHGMGLGSKLTKRAWQTVWAAAAWNNIIFNEEVLDIDEKVIDQIIHDHESWAWMKVKIKGFKAKFYDSFMINDYFLINDYYSTLFLIKDQHGII